MIISEKITEFYNKACVLNSASLQFGKEIAKLFPDVCVDVGIGKIVFSANIPNTIFERGIKYENIVLFEKNCDSASVPVISEFSPLNGGNVTISAYPSKDTVWSIQEQNSVEFFNQLIFVLFDRSNMYQTIQRAERTDSLTGALNNAGINRLGNLIFERHLLPKFSAMFLNFKKFKKINDVVGTKNGDFILREYAERVTIFLGKDGSIGRLGGDNFAIIVKNSKLGDLIKFLQNVKITVDVNGVSKTAIINVKAGISQGNPMLPGFEPLLGCAATAYKVARASDTEDFVFFKPEMGMPVPPVK